MMPPHWADVLALRPEVTEKHGQLGELQMSLYSVVSATALVPYSEVAYYCDITEPTPSLVGFMAQVAQRLGSDRAARALFHLDQGMGGGKSHALVGLYHLGTEPERFLDQELGQQVLAEVEQRAGGERLDLGDTHVVALPADHMSPGAPTPGYGPGTTLHERFIWRLFPDDRDRYRRLVAAGPDKGALKAALTEVGRPVLILLDELMDYAQQLADGPHRDRLPGERAFLNALMDAVDEVPRVAFVLVMIRSDRDEHGYPEEAQAVRDYVTQRVERNGITASVTEAEDLAAIVRRRLFERPAALPDRELADCWEQAADDAWREKVLDRLPSSRGLLGFSDRLESTYPFHPDLMALVQDDWSKHAGFQRVRSTVDIFASTAVHWAREHSAGRDAPPLIGVGDLPLRRMLESVLSSGLLHGNQRAVQGFRAVATSDVVSADGSRGRAVELDGRFATAHPEIASARPCLRMATALWLYSLVARAQGRRGATRPELLSAAFQADGLTFADADEALALLVDEVGGLGSLEVIQGRGGSAPTRYLLTTSQTLRMYHRQAREMVGTEERDELLWTRVQTIASKGVFDRPVFVESRSPETPLAEVFRDVDEAMVNRLVILDPRRWMLGNGRDAATRADITALLGLGPDALTVDNAASVVVACIDTRLREAARTRARAVCAYKLVQRMLDPDDELQGQAADRLAEEQVKLDGDLRSAYRHYVFLYWDGSSSAIDWARFEAPDKTALSGKAVWEELVEISRAVERDTLTGAYLVHLLDLRQRAYTLREVVRSFWQNAALPMVPGIGDVRSAIYDAVTLRHAWRILGSGGEELTITSPDALVINSAEQTVQVVEPEEPETDPGETGRDRQTGPGPGGRTARPGPTGEDGEDTGATYLGHVLRLPPKSLTDPIVRERVWQLFSELATVVDPAHELDVQLVEVGGEGIKLTASEDVLAGLHDKAVAAGGTWFEEPEDF